ncbi:MAG: serine/threonine protein kinase [Deltaproteobacteria bacterium]|nr:serine/threonine protein kinase [Deltaproteobacteria bacterium]
MAKAARICASCGSEYERDALFCPKDGTPLGNSRTQPGEDPYLGMVIADQIELRQLIGIGSMGRVYRAFQRGIERDVAVKMLHRELSANATLVGRFLREAKIASRLTHPNVVQVLMSGQLPPGAKDSATGNELYIVMEYLDGISLLSGLAACDGAMPLPRALHIVLQICDAVGEAHAQRIVHRDLKPENVMLVRRGDDTDFVKVLDFGIARFNWGEESATQAGLIFGTARYISPEGSQGETVGPQGDVYAIGTILFQCLAGRTPFDSESPVALLMQHAHEPPPHINSIPRASYVPAPVADAIMRSLSKTPGDRSPDARTFGRELVEAAKAAGMSPDELVMRSTLLGQRARGPVSFTSLERTKELNLSPEVKNQIGAYEASARSSRVSVEPAPPSSATIASGPADFVTSTPAPAAHSPSLSRVTVGPSSDIDPTMDDDDAPVGRAARVHKIRVTLFVIACFLAGAGAAALGAYRMGYLGSEPATSSASYLERANDAIRDHRWDSPPGDNVKDITDEGLQRFPGNPALLEVRARAAEDLVATALGRKYSGDVEGALGFAKLARELAPNSTTAQHLVAELEGLRVDSGPGLSIPSSTSQADSGPGVVPRWPRVPGSGSKTPPPLPSGSGTPVPPAPSTTPGRWL